MHQVASAPPRCLGWMLPALPGSAVMRSQALALGITEVDRLTDKLTHSRLIRIIIGIWIHPFARFQATMTQIEYSALDDQTLI